MVVTSTTQTNDGSATGFFLVELLRPYYALVGAGYTVDIASPKGGEAKYDPNSMHMGDPSVARFMNSDDRNLIRNTLRLADVKPAEYRGVVFIGGNGALFDFPHNADATRVAEEIWKQGGIVGAICYGPAALLDAKTPDGKLIISGRRMTCFSNDERGRTVLPVALETELRDRGAQYSASRPWQNNVVVDERLITAQNPTSGQYFGMELVRALGQ
jgi:putative intracellular protease/amidase